MKEKLIEELVEATAKRAYFASKCNHTFWFPRRFEGEYHFWKAKQEALIELLENL